VDSATRSASIHLDLALDEEVVALAEAFYAALRRSPGEVMATSAAPTVIYVSCGPAALGRDLVALARHGYTSDMIEPFDLMPGTAQVEILVRLRRPSRVPAVTTQPCAESASWSVPEPAQRQFHPPD